MPAPIVPTLVAPVVPVVAKPVVPVPPVGVKPPAAAVKPVVDPAAPVAPVVDDPIIWEGKVDGQLVKVKKSEADRLLSKGKFADKATQEAKETIRRAQKAAQELEAREAAGKERAKKDTDAWLREHGIDPDEYAKSKLERKVEEGKMTPEQRKALELEAENKRLKAEFETKEKEREAEGQKQLQARLQKQVENELVSACKRAGLALGDEAFFAVYESFRDAFELGLLPTDEMGLQPHHADRIVEDAMEKLDTVQAKLRENALKLKGKPLLDFIGKEAVDAIVAARLAEIRDSRGLPPTPAPAETPRPAPTRAPSGYISPREADEALKKLGGRAP